MHWQETLQKPPSKWSAWFDIGDKHSVAHQVASLLGDSAVFRVLRVAAKLAPRDPAGNPQINPLVWDALWRWYLISQTTSLRKLLDESKGVISIPKLLSKIENKEPEILDRGTIKSIRKKLKECEPLMKHVNNYIVHASDLANREKPTEEKRQLSIDKIQAAEKLVCEVYLRLERIICDAHVEPLPILEAVWFDFLDRPIAESHHVQELIDEWEQFGDEISKWHIDDWEELQQSEGQDD